MVGRPKNFKLLADIFIFKILCSRVYCYFHELVIKLILTILNEMK